MKSVLVLASLLFSVISSASDCPDLTGQFQAGQDTYEFINKVVDQKIIYQIDHDGDLTIPLTVGDSNDIIPRANGFDLTKTLSCRHGKLIYHEFYAGAIDEIHFELDQNADLVVTKSIHMPDQPFSGSSVIYQRIQ